MSGRLDEAAFRANVREAVTVWRGRLAAPGAAPRECAGIGREAAELRKVAEANGWWQLGQHLGNVENLSREAPTSLQDAVGALARRLAPSDEVPPSVPRVAPRGLDVAQSMAISGHSIALPPLLGDLASSRPDPPAPPPLVVAPATPQPPAPVVAPLPRAPEPVQVAEPAPLIPVPMAQPAPPKLFNDVLGLNAFGKSKQSRGEPAAKAGGLFGFRKIAPLPQAPNPPQGEPSAPPQRPFTAPSQSPSSALPQARPGVSMGAPGRMPSRPFPAAKVPSTPPRSPIARPRLGAVSAGIPRWFYALAGGVILLALTTIVVVAIGGPSYKKKPPPEAHVEAGPKPPPSTSDTAPPVTQEPGSIIDPHRGGVESESLRALIDAQGRLAATCRGEACSNPWVAFAREAMDPHSGPATLESAPPPQPLSAWLLKLKKPADFPLVEHPLLKNTFDVEAWGDSGHPAFQRSIRRCAAYADIIRGKLINYQAPEWLIAVVYQESQCDPHAKSPVGALGLWQFMPDSGRGYDLRVVEDVIDERLNPVKSTDAAVRFLNDLHRKLGAWDLALAAYNAGPYGVAARIARVGGHAGFWDLVRSGLLPNETASYVPAIEAHALVLSNLATLNFTTEGEREDATEIWVNPGTRLSLIARAANTSTDRIHQLNLDFLGEVVPQVPRGVAPVHTVRVPTSDAARAQEFLKSFPDTDKRDTCVPSNFDWGHADPGPFVKGCGHGVGQ